MLVVDTSALISLAVGDVLETVASEFEIVTTEAVVNELAETAEYDDRHGTAARNALELVEGMKIIDVSGDAFVTSRIDGGEASCVTAVREVDAVFLITDDYRALPELRELVAVDVALSPIVLRALVSRGAIHEEEAKAAFEMIAEGRDWLEAPIYRYARQLFE